MANLCNFETATSGQPFPRSGGDTRGHRLWLGKVRLGMGRQRAGQRRDIGPPPPPFIVYSVQVPFGLPPAKAVVNVAAPFGAGSPYGPAGAGETKVAVRNPVLFGETKPYVGR